MIKVNELSYRYNPIQKVLENISFELQDGSIYGLLGKNGEGKSTLLKLLVGLLSANGNHITVGNYEPKQRNPLFFSDLFFLPEEFELPKMSADTYVRLNSPLYPKFDKKRFDELLVYFEVSRFSNLQNCSFGQKKKFILAFGLACNTKYIMLDEPTNALDIPSKVKLRVALKDAMNSEKICLISTHQARELEDVFESILLLNNNNIIFNDSLKHVNETFSLVKDYVEGAVYGENLGSSNYRSLVLGANGGRIDLEFFFNALLVNSNQIVKLMEQSSHE